MSKHRRSIKSNATGRSLPSNKHVRFYDFMLRSEAWHHLSGNGCKLLMELARRHNGHNNGDIALSVREAAQVLRGGKDKARKTLAELQQLGFIKVSQMVSIRPGPPGSFAHCDAE